MAEQGRSRESQNRVSQAAQQEQRNALAEQARQGNEWASQRQREQASQENDTMMTTSNVQPSVPPKKPVDEEVNDLLVKESDPEAEPDASTDVVRHMRSVFSAMKRHFDNARKEALDLPNSEELAAMLGHLNMAEFAMDAMVAHAEVSMV